MVPCANIHSWTCWHFSWCRDRGLGNLDLFWDNAYDCSYPLFLQGLFFPNRIWFKTCEKKRQIETGRATPLVRVLHYYLRNSKIPNMVKWSIFSDHFHRSRAKFTSSGRQEQEFSLQLRPLRKDPLAREANIHEINCLEIDVYRKMTEKTLLELARMAGVSDWHS